MVPTTNVFADAHRTLGALQSNYAEYLGEIATDATEELLAELSRLAMDYESGMLLTAFDDVVMNGSAEDTGAGAAGHEDS